MRPVAWIVTWECCSTCALAGSAARTRAAIDAVIVRFIFEFLLCTEARNATMVPKILAWWVSRGFVSREFVREISRAFREGRTRRISKASAFSFRFTDKLEGTIRRFITVG
jgi:hypothetical protein